MWLKGRVGFVSSVGGRLVFGLARFWFAEDHILCILSSSKKSVLLDTQIRE